MKKNDETLTKEDRERVLRKAEWFVKNGIRNRADEFVVYIGGEHKYICCPKTRKVVVFTGGNENG